ncbi:MAG: hypothetical protein J6S21_02480 [Victivallales bacterium]|nr:hypothetical protein [Victivallales bacterium]
MRRVICADDFVAGGFYRIELEVSHPGALPGAMVVSEDWPDGFEIIDGYWGGVRFRPVERSGVYSWLFGYGDGNPAVASGTLSYLISVPENCRQHQPEVFGKVSIAGESAEITGDSRREFLTDGVLPPSQWLELPSGWSMQMLSFEGAASGAELSGGGRCFVLGSGNAWVQWRGATLPADTPCWIWREKSDSMLLTEAYCKAETSAKPVRRHPGGWRVDKSSMLREGTEAHLWQNGSYNKVCTAIGVSQPVWTLDKGEERK